MPSPSNLLSLGLLYVCLLFVLAWYADRGSRLYTRRRSSIYALSLAVYCSSWTFYGAVGSATDVAWAHAPIYLGPILMFTLGWPIIRRLLETGQRHQVTSIADYLGARYGKRPALAVLVTLVAATAVIPYIALQYKALAQAWDIVGGSLSTASSGAADTAFFVAITLAIFTVLFGTRRVDGRERHRGVVMAIAVESLVKLLAFACVAALALAFLWSDDSGQVLAEAEAWKTLPLDADFIARTLISACAILCLPRQFHIMVVESPPGINHGVARWMFPLYLLLFLVMVIPVSLAGLRLFGDQAATSPDTWVQLIPMLLEQEFIAVVAFIGGISAATGMAIVAALSLAIMVTNEILSPLIMRVNAQDPQAVLRMGDNLRRTRQITIVAIMMSAWLVTRQIADIPWLAQIGFICFLAAAQLAPALLAGLYWRRGHGLGVMVGLVFGLLLWFYCGVLPAVLPVNASLLVSGPLGIGWLSPLGLLGIESNGGLSYAVCWSLGVNTLLFFLSSMLLSPRAGDLRQARLFLGGGSEQPVGEHDDFEHSLIRVSQLQALLLPFTEGRELQRMWVEFEQRYQQRLLPGDRAPRFVVNQVESVLAGIIGASSAHRAMEQLENSQQLEFTDLAGMVSDASRLHVFNRELLQTTVDSLVQGISVVDAELRLVAWNSRYEEMFDYPERFLYVGCPIERVYRYNAQRGYLNVTGDGAQEIEKRLELLRRGEKYRIERVLPDGTVLEVQGQPLPRGGYVASYVDITDYREMTQQLEEAKLELESEVESGRELLSEANAELRQENRLRAQMERHLREAHQGKSRFMSATSHDLLQPINAARLFTQVLKSRDGDDLDGEARHVVDQIDHSLKRAEQLIEELREMARLDSGRQATSKKPFALGPLLAELGSEFAEYARQQGLVLKVQENSLWVESDRSVLQRMIQNLLSNALKYTDRGKVVLGARRRGKQVEIQVLDTGAGIAEEDQARIFEEFERLQGGDTATSEKGLGLGLSIVQRSAQLLDHPLLLKSVRGGGSMFSILVPRIATPLEAGGSVAADANADFGAGELSATRVLCLDNEVAILEGMRLLLENAGAQVKTARDRSELTAILQSGYEPTVILADYHLDDGDTGLAVMEEVVQTKGDKIACVFISADDSPEVRDRVRQRGCRFMAKPVDARRLTTLLRALQQ